MENLRTVKRTRNFLHVTDMAKRRLIDVFDEDFARELRQATNNPEAFDRATEKFEREHGFVPFESYDSFRNKKLRSRKKQ